MSHGSPICDERNAPVISLSLPPNPEVIPGNGLGIPAFSPRVSEGSSETAKSPDADAKPTRLLSVGSIDVSASSRNSKIVSPRVSEVSSEMAKSPDADGKPTRLLSVGSVDVSASSRNSRIVVCEIGDRVLVSGRNPGTVRFVGVTQFSSDGVWVGVELDLETGKNDGTVKGVSYFTCAPRHGVFVRPTMLSKITEAESDPPQLERSSSFLSPTDSIPRLSSPRTPRSPRSSASDTMGGTWSEPPKRSTPKGKRGPSVSRASGIADDRKGSMQIELAEAVENHDTARIRQMLPAASQAGVAIQELEAAQRILNFEGHQSVLNEMEELRSAVHILGQAVNTAEDRIGAMFKVIDNDVIPKVRDKIDQSLYDFDNRIEKAIEAAITPAVQEFGAALLELKMVHNAQETFLHNYDLKKDFVDKNAHQQSTCVNLVPASSALNTAKFSLESDASPNVSACDSACRFDDLRFEPSSESPKEGYCASAEAVDEGAFKLNRSEGNPPIENNPPIEQHSVDTTNDMPCEVPRRRVKSGARQGSSQLKRSFRSGSSVASSTPRSCGSNVDFPTSHEACVAVRKLQSVVRSYFARNRRTTHNVACAALSLHRKFEAIFRGYSTNGNLDEDTFGEAIAHVHPSLKKAQAQALWIGCMKGTRKNGVGQSLFCDIAEAVARGSVDAAEFADMAPEKYLALNDVVTSFPTSESETMGPATSWGSTSRKKSFAGQLRRALHAKPSPAQLATLSNVIDSVTDRQTRWANIFRSHCSDEEDTLSELAFHAALCKIHPKLAEQQVDALWKGFTAGAGLFAVPLSPFCKIAEAVAIGDEAASEFADVSAEDFAAMGRRGSALLQLDGENRDPLRAPFTTLDTKFPPVEFEMRHEKSGSESIMC